MRTFATFLIKSAVSDELIEACGDRATIIIDGRHNLDTAEKLAKETAIALGFRGYHLYRGTSLLDARIVRRHII